MKASPRLIIVQNRPTQFDAPLYARIRECSALQLRVYYTESAGPNDVRIDDEIGRSPEWDHLAGKGGDDQWTEYVPRLRASTLAARMASHSPDLVIISGYYPWRHARLALSLRRRGVRIGLRSDNTLRHSRFVGVKGLAKRQVLPSLLRMYDTWHPVGTLAAEYLTMVAGDRRPTFLFPYSVDNEWLQTRVVAVHERRNAVRDQMGFAPADFVVVGALKWTTREDPLTLVEAFLIASETCADLRLLLVGDGPLREVVRERLRPRLNRVHLPGYVPYSELPRHYGVADVFVHPAVSEPWGVSVNEAMACGLPVVAAQGVGAAADLVLEGRTGYAFADGDSRTLAALLRQMAADRQLTRRLGKAARARIADWDYQHTIKELERAVAYPLPSDKPPEPLFVATSATEMDALQPGSLSLSIVIPTYGREEVLVRTVAALLRIGDGLPGLQDLLIIDQTSVHEPATALRLEEWSRDGRIRWLRESEPNLTRAMNTGLRQATGDIVLFLDDDIVPGAGLLRGHLDAYRVNPALTAVVGQVLQPEEEPVARAFVPRGGNLRRFLDFPFFSTKGRLIENVMAGNLSVRRVDSIAVGGFDENFVGPVASRFETEFAKRLVASGKLIWFEPSASIRHLRAPTGGTRSLGSHLSSALPCFGVGDYYYALRAGKGIEKWWYVARKPWREVRTRFHLRHPWWIPVKLVGEVRAFVQAWRAVRGGPRLLKRGQE